MEVDDFYGQILEIETPWEVSKVRLDKATSIVHVELSTWTKLAALAVVVTLSAVGATTAAACDPPCQYKKVVV